MAKKRHTTEQIISKLREAEVELARGQGQIGRETDPTCVSPPAACNAGIRRSGPGQHQDSGPLLKGHCHQRPQVVQDGRPLGFGEGIQEGSEILVIGPILLLTAGDIAGHGGRVIASDCVFSGYGASHQTVDPEDGVGQVVDPIQCRERLGGMLMYYYRDAV